MFIVKFGEMVKKGVVFGEVWAVLEGVGKAADLRPH